MHDACEGVEFLWAVCVSVGLVGLYLLPGAWTYQPDIFRVCWGHMWQCILQKSFGLVEIQKSFVSGYVLQYTGECQFFRFYAVVFITALANHHESPVGSSDHSQEHTQVVWGAQVLPTGCPVVSGLKLDIFG